MKQIVIIGNSAAGISAAEAIRAKNKDISITIISQEPQRAYYRTCLPEFFMGSAKETELVFKAKDFYEENNIKLLNGKKVERVRVKRNTILLEDKTKVPYDVLIIATGIAAKMPKDIKGMNKYGVFEMREFSQLKEIVALIPFTHTACVFGAGIAGVKIAVALGQRGLDEIRIIVPFSRLLPELLNDKAASVLQSILSKQGIDVFLEKNIAEVFGESDVKAIKVDSGKVFGCGLLLVDMFKVPQMKFVLDTDIKVEDSGISADWNMKTSVANVFTAGDVSQVFTPEGYAVKTSKTWENAQKQGAVAGMNALSVLEGNEGEMVKWSGPIEMKNLEFSGLPVFVLGMINKPENDSQIESFEFVDEENDVYRRIFACDNKLLGFTGVGGSISSVPIFELIEKKADINEIKDILLSAQISVDFLNV